MHASPIFEENSASDLTREASRVCAATEVAERRNCFAQADTSSRFLGSYMNNRIDEDPNRFARSRSSRDNRPPKELIRILRFQLSEFQFSTSLLSALIFVCLITETLKF